MKDFAAELMTTDGYIIPKKMASLFHTTIVEVSCFTGLSLATLRKPDRVRGAKVQAQLQTVIEILTKIIPWAGNAHLAYAWYRSEPIPAFGDLTAENLVTRGKGDLVKSYIEHMALGGYA